MNKIVEKYLNEIGNNSNNRLLMEQTNDSKIFREIDRIVSYMGKLRKAVKNAKKETIKTGDKIIYINVSDGINDFLDDMLNLLDEKINDDRMFRDIDEQY